MQVQELVIEVLARLLPEDSVIRQRTSGGSVLISADWPLHTDPARPNKSSREITVEVTREAIQDFTTLPAPDEPQAKRRIERFVRSRLSAFEPNHNAPRSKPPPTETWVIDTETILGS